MCVGIMPPKKKEYCEFCRFCDTPHCGICKNSVILNLPLVLNMGTGDSKYVCNLQLWRWILLVILPHLCPKKSILHNLWYSFSLAEFARMVLMYGRMLWILQNLCNPFLTWKQEIAKKYAHKFWSGILQVLLPQPCPKKRVLRILLNLQYSLFLQWEQEIVKQSVVNSAGVVLILNWILKILLNSWYLFFKLEQETAKKYLRSD